MAVIKRYVVVIVAANIFAISSLFAANLCPIGDFSEKPNKVACRVEPNEPLCLVCPISKWKNNTWWKRDSVAVYRNGHKVSQENFTRNACHSTLESLKVPEVGIYQHHKVFTCSSGNSSNTIYTYMVEIEAHTVLYIQETVNGSILNNSFISSHREIFLQCVLRNGFGNLTLTWEINGEKTHVKRYKSDDNVINGTYVSIFKYNNTDVPRNVTCISTGPFVRDGSVSCIFATSIHDKRTTDLPKILIIVILVLASIGAIVAFSLYKRKDSRPHSKSLNSKRGSSHISQFASSPNNQTVIYAQVAAKRTHTNDESETQIGVILKQYIKRTSKFEYWKGTWMKNSHGEQNCFVKTLNDDNTLKTASDFKILAEHLNTLQAHPNIVTILSIFTDQVPYSVHYEQMDFGTLRDILMRNYQESKSFQKNDDNTVFSPIDSKGQTEELMSFSLDIAEAMAYITSQNYSHPALCARKVLLTEHGRCKLYDIYPTEMAILKVNDEMHKKFPPVAWLAPETILCKEYSLASDIWNFAVVLWEIFAIGDIPYKGMSQKQVEQNIKQFAMLPQPQRCPGAIFSMMLSCWVTSGTERPTFESLKCQLVDLTKS